MKNLTNRKIRFNINVVYIEHYVCYRDKDREREKGEKETEIVVVMKNAWLWS